MTAATSNKIKSFFGTRFFNDIKSSKQLFIVNIVLQILGIPMLAVIAVVLMYIENLPEHNELMDVVSISCVPFVFISVGTVFLAICLGVVIAMLNFSYLYRKTIVDMHYSLPLTTTHRFFADFLSGLSIYIIPALGAIMLSLGILGVGSIITDMSEIWKAVPMMLREAFIVIMAMLLLYAISVFALTFCGNTFEAIFSVFSFMLMLPATICCVWLALVHSAPFGISGSSIFFKNIFTSTSPIGTFAFFIQHLDTYMEDSPSDLWMYCKWMAITFIVLLLYVGAAYLLYRFRKAEDVSKPYVYKAFFYVIMTMAVFCILSLFISLNGFVVAGILMCAIGWFIMEIITRRGFKKFWTAPIGFVAAVLSVFLICGICDVTHGFGMAKHVPATVNIERVEISDCDILDYNNITFKDKEVIKQTAKLNKEIVDRYFNYEDYSYDYFEKDQNVSYDDYCDTSITLKYHTLTGSVVMREYSVPSTLMGDLTKAIVLSDEYADFVSDDLNYRVNYYRDDVNPTMINPLRVRDIFGSSIQNVENYKEQIYELSDRYRDDMKKMTAEDLENENIYCYIDDYFVLDSFTDTIEYLKEMGYSFDNEKLITEHYYTAMYIDAEPVFASRCPYYYDPDNNEKYDSYRYYSSDDYDDVTKHAKLDKITNISFVSYYDMTDFKNMTYFDEEMIDFVNALSPLLFNEKPLAVVCVNDTTLYLKDNEKNRALLEDFKENYMLKNHDYSGDDYYSDAKIPLTVGSGDIAIYGDDSEI